MVKRKIISKTISKSKWKRAEAGREMKKLTKMGFKNVYVTDYKTVGKGRKIKGVGTKIEAFKGWKKSPKGYRSKMEDY